MTKDKKEQLNALAEKWCLIPDDAANAAAKQSAWLELCESTVRAYLADIFARAINESDEKEWESVPNTAQTISDSQRLTTETLYILMAKEVKQKFDIHKGEYVSFVSSRLKFRKKDQRRKKRKVIEALSLDAAMDHDGDVTLYHSVSRLEATDPEDALIKSELGNTVIDPFLERFTAMIINFRTEHRGKAQNAARERYYRAFYTSGMTGAVKSQQRNNEVPMLKKHERDMFTAMDVGYLDFYMTMACRTIEEIYGTSLKNYCDVIPEAPELPIPLPIPNKVCSAYFGVSEAAVSMQLKVFKDETERLRELL